jgi:predicted HTH domain antitoxin
MRLAAAIFWYQKNEISQEKAAQIAGLNRRDFILALSRQQIDVFSVDFDDLQEELNRV